MKLLLDILQGLGLSQAAGIRPFLPALRMSLAVTALTLVVALVVAFLGQLLHLVLQRGHFVGGFGRIVDIPAPLLLADPAASAAIGAGEARILGEIADPRAEGILTRSLTDSDPAVRRAAEDGLARFRERRGMATPVPPAPR